jgi:hypothetical protein
MGGPLRVHYDIMSYEKMSDCTKFSDHNASKPIPRNLAGSGAPAPGVHEMPGVWLYPGTQTWIFGPEAALAVDEARRLEMQGAGGQAQSSTNPGNPRVDPPWDSEIAPAEPDGPVGLTDAEEPGAFDLDAYMQHLIANNRPLPSIIFTALPSLGDPSQVSCRFAR